MELNFPSSINADITDAITTPNIKVIVANWMALGEKVMMVQLVQVSTFGHLLQPDHATFQAPDGLVDQWQAFAAAHRTALAEAEQRGGLHESLMAWAYPQFDRFVLHFMAAAIKARAKAAPDRPAPRREGKGKGLLGAKAEQGTKRRKPRPKPLPSGKRT